MFILKLDATGFPLWARGFGGPEKDAARAVAIDAQGDIYVVGEVSGNVVLGGTGLRSAGDTDALVMRMDAAGTPIWAKAFGGGGSETATSIAWGDGRLYLVGSMTSDTDFGGGPLDVDDGADGFVVSLDGDGGHRWSFAVGGPGTEYIDSIVFSSSLRAVTFALSFEQTVNLGFGQTLTSMGGVDSLVMRVSE